MTEAGYKEPQQQMEDEVKTSYSAAITSLRAWRLNNEV